MTSSETLRRKAEQLIDTLYPELSEARLAADVDRPIDAAVLRFRFCWPRPFSPERFQRVTAAFVAHVYRRGLACPQQLDPRQARDEAMAILERDYRDEDGTGYEAALLLAAHSDDGMDQVLIRIAESIKVRCRNACITGAYARHLPPFDDQLRCAVASILLSRCRRYMGADWLPAPVELLPPLIPDFMKSLLTTDQDVSPTAASMSPAT
jgi:hypothetical protein